MAYCIAPPGPLNLCVTVRGRNCFWLTEQDTTKVYWVLYIVAFNIYLCDRERVF